MELFITTLPNPTLGCASQHNQQNLNFEENQQYKSSALKLVSVANP